MATNEAVRALGPPEQDEPAPAKSDAAQDPKPDTKLDTVTPADAATASGSPPPGGAPDPLEAHIKNVLADSQDLSTTIKRNVSTRQKELDDLRQDIANRKRPELPGKVDVPAAPKYNEESPLNAATSIASVIGMLGSLKTRAPLTSSLNAAAATMKAVRERNVQDFQLHSQEWKENTDKLLKESQLDYERYKTVFESDKYSDDQRLALIRAGAVGDQDLNMAHAAQLGDLQLAETMWRDRATLSQQAKQAADSVNWQRVAYDDFKRIKPKATPQETAEYMASLYPKVGMADFAAREQLYQQAKVQMETELGHPLSPEEDLALRNKYTLSAKDSALSESRKTKADAISSFYENTWKKVPENQGKGWDDFITDWQRFHGTVDPAVKADLAGRRVAVAEKNQDRLGAADAERQRHNFEVEDLNGRKFDSEDERKRAVDIERVRHNKAMEDMYGKRAGSSVTNMRADAIRAKLDEIRNREHREPSAAEQTQAINEVTKGGLTGNKAESLEARVDHFDDSLNKIDQTTAVLNKYVGAAGEAGKALRLKERVGNLVGNDQTDRVQFMRNIEYLQMMGTRLMTDAGGRPLSGEAQRITDIIGGLNLGDTTANTLRSLDEIQKLYTKMRKDTLNRLQGTWTPQEGQGGGGSGGAGQSTGKKFGWQDAPMVAP